MASQPDPDRRPADEVTAPGGVDGAEAQDLKGAEAAVETEEPAGPLLVLRPAGVVPL